MDIYEGLDERQLEAVKHGDSPLLVLAAPGSGKTRMLTHRVAHLVMNCGIHPRNILVTTFTKKAAQEMEERLERLIEAAAWELNIGTIHSACSRIIRRYGPERVGLKDRFTTYDTDDQRGVVGDTLDALVKERAVRRDYKPGEIIRAISFAKDCGLGPQAWPPRRPGERPGMRELFAEYDRRLRQANAADFGDLQVLAVRLLEEHPDVLARVRAHYRYVLVDEYQDINPIQAELFRLLCDESRHLTVVGDTDQCIPRGEKVLTPKGQVPIEQLEVGQFVMAVSGKKVRPAKVKKVWKSQHEQVLEFRTSSSRVLRCTPNHVIYASQSAKVGGYYVYLMWKPGVGYRVGSTSGGLLEGKSRATRVGIEHAERMWALGHEQTKSAARYAELRLSLRYGIPTVPFMRRQGERLSEKDRLRLFREFDGGEKLLADYGLSFDRPMYMSKATSRGRIAINVGQAADSRGTIVDIESDHLPTRFLRKWQCSAGKGSTRRLRRLFRGYKEAVGFARRLLADLPPGLGYVSERLGIGRVPASTRPIEAAQLRVGMSVVVPDGAGSVRHERVVSRKVIEGEFECFDLEVEDVANYFVGGVCVHNSVYAFRSATPKFALQFAQDWEDGKIVRLEKNYRSTQAIVRASNAVIQNNVNRYGMVSRTDNPEGEPVRIMALATPEDEAARAAYLLSRHHGSGVPWSQMAVLYRLHRSSRVYESALIANSIPYHLHGSIRFFDREEIKDLLAWMRICVNPADVESFKRACASVPIRMGKATVSAIADFADRAGIPVLEAAARAGEIETIGAGARSAARGFVALVADLIERIDDDDFVGSIRSRIEYQRTLDKKEDGVLRLENVRELADAYASFRAQVVEAGGSGRSAVELFLSEAALQTNRDKDSDGVWVGSVHAAKGCEFDVVLVVDCEDGFFPHAYTLSNPRAPEGLPEPDDDPMEEERRLWYVAITRPRKALYLLWARSRTMLIRPEYGKAYMAPMPSSSSPFIDEARIGGAVDVQFRDFVVPRL